MPNTLTWEDLIAQTGRVLIGNTAYLRGSQQVTIAARAQPSTVPLPCSLAPVPSEEDEQRALELPEAALLRQIITLAKRTGWKVYHTHDSRHSEAGFPDLVLAKPGRLIFAECKRRTGKLTAAQAQWLDLLRHTLPTLEVYTWRPADWPAIVAIVGGSTLTRQPGGAL